MKFLYTLLFAVVFHLAGYSQSIVGKWETFDDETETKKAVVEIYRKDDLYFGKITKSYVGGVNAICKNCKGDKKDKPIIGLVIIENLKKDGDEFNGGTILDPETGKTYKCYLELMGNTKLKVRGYLGFSLLGRTQYWKRAE